MVHMGSGNFGLQFLDRFSMLVPVTGYSRWPLDVPENIYDLVDIPV